ncbi:hypothetical protein [Vibrio phage vB_VaM_H2]|nr:hypothetical protein [Vibrio phage vB_VaM_H2]
MGYKTFEDMKHDIPEGATHYHNESDSYLFCWFKVEGGKWFVLCPDEGSKWYKCNREHHRSGIVQFLQTESTEGREALDMIDTTSKQVESLESDAEFPNGSEYDRAAGGPVKLSLPEWDGWDEEGYAECIPHEPGINVMAFIDAKVNGTNGSRGRWVEAKTVCSCYASNGGAQVVVEFAGRNYAISAITYLRKPESPEQKAERERLEAAYDLYLKVQERDEGPGFAASFKQFQDGMMSTCRKDYLSIVDITGYRKESK